MKLRNIGVYSAIAAICFGGLAISQEPPQGENEDMAKMMAASMAVRSPGEHHKAMEYFLGKWNVEITMKGFGAQPDMTSKGVAEFKWLIAGRWMAQDLNAQMGGMPYRSYSIAGFDNVKKKFVTTVVNNMDTAMLRVEGTVVDPTGKINAQYGTLDEYLTDEHDKPFRTVTKKTDDDHFVLEIWDLGIGENGKIVMLFDYARIK
ncbi:MAG: DUF1579 family protein [Planctomycetota bacterium]